MKQNLSVEDRKSVRPITKLEVGNVAACPDLFTAGLSTRYDTNPNSLIGIGYQYINHAKTEKEERVSYNLTSIAINNRLLIGLTDVYLGALNTCIDNHLIDPNVVNIERFCPMSIDFADFSSNVDYVGLLYCQDLFNKLYSYAMFNAYHKNTGEVVNKINEVIGLYSGVILYHLSKYVNNMLMLVASRSKEQKFLDAIGAYDNMYADSNIVGNILIGNDDELLNDNKDVINEVIEKDKKYADKVKIELDFYE